MHRFAISALVLLLVAIQVDAQDRKGAAGPTLLTATGVVDKAEKDSLVVTPRSSSGRFEKAITLKVTGTSKLSVVAPQKRAGKTVLVQRDAGLKDLVPGQAIAVIYAESGKDGAVLLSAVAHTAASK